MKLYKPQFVALVLLAFFASGYIANFGLLLQRPIWQEPLRTYKYTVEPGHDVEITVGGAGDTQTVQESFYNTGNSTWKAPAGVTSIQVELWGGGGAGGGLTTNLTVCRGGGGAGGQYVASSSFPVTEGTNYLITIGAGGTGSTGSGTAGASSTFAITSPIFVAQGGAGGQSYEAGAGAGSGSTTNASGTIIYAGGNGSAGGTGTTGGAGGGGGATSGTGNNASGNTAGAYKTDLGGVGGAGRTSNGVGNTPTSALTSQSFGFSSTYYGYGGGGGAAAHTTTADSTDRAGGAGGAGGARITYTNNTAYLYYSGNVGAGSSSYTTAFPLNTTSTDLLIVAIVFKHASSTATAPDSTWTKIADIEGGHRPSYLTADQGAVRTVVYAREATSSLISSVNFSATSPNGDSGIGKMYRFIKSPGTTWEYATSTGADNTAGTSWVVTSTNNLLIQPDDMILAVSGINGDAATFSSEAFSAISGITFGSVTGEMLDYANTTGLDTRLVTFMQRVYSGTTSTAPLIYTMTGSGTSTNRPLGSTVFIVIRQAGSASTPVEVQDVIFFD